jgi:hypothetical protein
MNRVDAWRMIQRRAADLGTRIKVGCHTFRATGIGAFFRVCVDPPTAKDMIITVAGHPGTSKSAQDRR